MAGVPAPKHVDPDELFHALRFAPQCVRDAIDNLAGHATLVELRNAELEQQLKTAMSIQRRQRLLADELMERVVKLTHALAASGDSHDEPTAKLSAEAQAAQRSMNEFLNRLKKGS